MEYKDVRELVRIRHELRTLAGRHDRDGAARLLERMHSIAERDDAERAALEPEVRRWRFVFGLEG